VRSTGSWHFLTLPLPPFALSFTFTLSLPLSPSPTLSLPLSPPPISAAEIEYQVLVRRGPNSNHTQIETCHILGAVQWPLLVWSQVRVPFPPPPSTPLFLSHTPPSSALFSLSPSPPLLSSQHVLYFTLADLMTILSCTV
jgi:hypothetical protein